MSRHHLEQSWSVILQQAWSMCLKDKLHSSSTPTHSYQGNPASGSGNKQTPWRKLCFDFNAGNCTIGRKCKFDHRCSFCNKFGHGSVVCRKAANKRGNGSSGRDGDQWDKYEKEQMKNVEWKNKVNTEQSGHSIISITIGSTV